MTRLGGRWLIGGLVMCAGVLSVRAQNEPAPIASPYGPRPAVLPKSLDPEKDVRPPVLRQPTPEREPSGFIAVGDDYPITPFDSPNGFAGPSGIAPRITSNRDYVPLEDRWRLGFPFWDRYGRNFPPLDDYPYERGNIWNPFNQNVLKGDYPIIGQHTFLEVTLSTLALFETRQIPTATTPFESTARAFQQEFFGRPNQFFYSEYFKASLDLFHGDAAFKPVDWRIKVTGILNVNNLDVSEHAVVNPNVLQGSQRYLTWMSLEEWFGEVKLADLGPEYDFVSARAGSQFFTSDFRGFIFSDTNRAIRLFGTRLGNRDQFNILYFDQSDKDVNSGLNTFDDRHQNVLIANYYRQDFVFPGYTAQWSVHWNNDQPSFQFDKNKFLVRPDPAGVFEPHRVEAVYLGMTGDGHIGRYNITNAFYWVVGHDGRNPIANQEQDISAQMAALELSYDRDWARFRTSFFWSSGDGNPRNRHATGFDSIFDNPNFAGGEFSFWQRQQIPLFGVNLVQRNSIIPDLRSSKIQGQSNFVNPGLFLFNAGFDMDITPKLRMINNANFLMFDKTAVLEQFLFDGQIDREIGVDLSVGFEYRPLLSNNVILTCGVSTLLPGKGFKQLYNRFSDPVNPLGAAFIEAILTY